MPYADPVKNVVSSREGMRELRARRKADDVEPPRLSREAQRAIASTDPAPARPLRTIDDILSALEEAYAIARNDPATDPISKSKAMTNTARAAGSLLEAACLEQRVIQLEEIASVKDASADDLTSKNRNVDGEAAE